MNEGRTQGFKLIRNDGFARCKMGFQRRAFTRKSDFEALHTPIQFTGSNTTENTTNHN